MAFPCPSGREAQLPAHKTTPRQRIVIAPTMPGKKPLVKTKPKALDPQAVDWTCWWPFIAGIALRLLAPQIRSLLAALDPWGMRAVMPFVQFCGLPEIGMDEELTRSLPQLMLFLQFPLEGLLTVSNLKRGIRLSAAIGQIVFLHFVCGLVLWIVALGSMPQSNIWHAWTR